MRAEEEVPQVDELAVVLILDVDNAPPVLTTADLLAIDNDGLLGADNSEGDQALFSTLVAAHQCKPSRTNLNLAIDGTLLIIKLVVVVGVHLEVVERKLLLDALLERLSLL